MTDRATAAAETFLGARGFAARFCAPGARGAPDDLAIAGGFAAPFVFEPLAAFGDAAGL